MSLNDKWDEAEKGLLPQLIGKPQLFTEGLIIGGEWSQGANTHVHAHTDEDQ